jgi:hypothetical protein
MNENNNDIDNLGCSISMFIVLIWALFVLYPSLSGVCK